jgi:SAM-dependent methyltransferase
MTDIDPKAVSYQAYQKMARDYIERADTAPYNALYERPATLSLLPDVKGMRVLDAGSGPGVYAEWLVEHGASVLGLDFNQQFIEAATERLDGRAVFCLTDLNQPLDFLDDGTFDLVLSALVMHYLEDWAAIFAEFWRVLKPGGWFVFSTHHPFVKYHVTDEFSYFETRLLTEFWGSVNTHVSYFHRPLSAMTDAIFEAGFQLDRILEPLPVEAMKATDPDDYEKLSIQPNFIFFRARKPQ